MKTLNGRWVAFREPSSELDSPTKNPKRLLFEADKEPHIDTEGGDKIAKAGK